MWKVTAVCYQWIGIKNIDGSVHLLGEDIEFLRGLKDGGASISDL